MDVIDALLEAPPERRRHVLAALDPAERTLVMERISARLNAKRTGWARYAQDPVGFVTEGLRETMWSKQREILESLRDNKRTAVPACHAPGKLGKISEPILTPSGWRTHGDIRVGDEVFDADGRVVAVTAVIPQGVQAIYRVTMNDGQWMDVGLDHLWVVKTKHAADAGRLCAVCPTPLRQHPPNATFCPVHRVAIGDQKHCSNCLDALPLDEFAKDRSKPDGRCTRCNTCRLRRRRGEASPVEPTRGAWRIASTRDLLAHGGMQPFGHRRATIPVCKPVQFPAQGVPLDPYVLGLVLGDGWSGEGVHFCSADPELVEVAAALGGAVAETRPGFWRVSLPGCRPTFRALDLYGKRSWEKHVPDLYLHNSPDVRQAVLQGLMDTDGTVDASRSVTEFSTTSPHLAEAVEFLAQSLGGLARTTTRTTRFTDKHGQRVDGRLSYRVSLTMPVNPFRLARKARQWERIHAKRTRPISRQIASIEHVGEEEAVCFVVDSPSRTYLGRGCIVTHNSHIAARAVGWWVACHPPGTARVVTTASTFRQVRNVLWPHIRRLHSKYDLPGDCLTVEWKVDGTVVADGFSPADHDEAAVQGVHAPHLLVVVDEAGGLGPTLGNALEALMTGGHTRMLVLGNPPTHEEGTWFERICQSRLYNVITIGWEHTPNFTGEPTDDCAACPDEVEPHKVGTHLIDQTWVDDLIDQFGADSAFVEAKVHGRFPRITASKTIPLFWLEAAAQNDDPEVSDVISLGCDIAADGGDEFAIAEYDRGQVGLIHASSGMANANAVDVAGVIAAKAREAVATHQARGVKRPVRVKIDGIGVGWGVASILQTWVKEKRLEGVQIVVVNVAERAGDPNKFSNQRAEMWWNGRLAVQPDAQGRQRIRVNLDRRTLAQLATPSFKSDSAGRIVIEAKKDIKKRGMPSPDRGEAALLALYEPPGGMVGAVMPVSLTKENTFRIR